MQEGLQTAFLLLVIIDLLLVHDVTYSKNLCFMEPRFAKTSNGLSFAIMYIFNIILLELACCFF